MPGVPRTREKQAWTMQPWQERTLLSLVSLQPKGPVADVKVISRKHKVLSKSFLALDIL